MSEAATNTYTAPPRNRAQVLRDKVAIRLATDEMGKEIDAILKANGVDLPVDWSKVFPHWLIATVEDEVVGCCQVLPAKPVGFVEFLFVKPTAPFKVRAIAVRKLMVQGMSTLYHAGSSVCGAVVSEKNKKFADVIEKINFVRSMQSAGIFVKRLR